MYIYNYIPVVDYSLWLESPLRLVLCIYTIQNVGNGSKCPCKCGLATLWLCLKVDRV